MPSTLPRLVSNHSPNLLDGGGIKARPIPFRFETMWLKEEGFKNFLRGGGKGLSLRVLSVLSWRLN